jgi:hypothetical protein
MFLIFTNAFPCLIRVKAPPYSQAWQDTTIVSKFHSTVTSLSCLFLLPRLASPMTSGFLNLRSLDSQAVWGDECSLGDSSENAKVGTQRLDKY